MADRIRWSDNDYGGLIGCAGTLDPHAFQIWKPLEGESEWVLTASLPGMEQVARYGPDPAALKPDAEQLFAEFVSSLGAVFPDESEHPATSRCECGGTVHVGSGRDRALLRETRHRGRGALRGVAGQMTVSDLIRVLLEHPMDSQVYIGKGMGPLSRVEPYVSDRIYVILSPEQAERGQGEGEI